MARDLRNDRQMQFVSAPFTASRPLYIPEQSRFWPKPSEWGAVIWLAALDVVLTAHLVWAIFFRSHT